VRELILELDRVNVVVGANGRGKTKPLPQTHHPPGDGAQERLHPGGAVRPLGEVLTPGKTDFFKVARALHIDVAARLP